MSNTNIKKVRTSDLELKDRLVSIQRVTKVTKGGRTFSFSAIVVVGNEDGNTNIKKVRTSDLELKDRLVSIQRVTKVTKGGRTFSFSAIVVVGNEDGVVGYGLGKASEVQSAIAKGVEDAKKNLVKIPVINGTIPHKQESRYSGSLVMIRPAAPGTGVIAGGAMRAVLESVGIKNVLAKSKGSSNPHNLVKATIGALCELRDAHSIARVRGISMDKVFNG